ncbi:hypothetical protein, partial [Salmonella enterica]|uniref:hypothetical protein n=1 Tax=Salmonella enterica TaxID=28901 RepID=UPI00398C2BBE
MWQCHAAARGHSRTGQRVREGERTAATADQKPVGTKPGPRDQQPQQAVARQPKYQQPKQPVAPQPQYQQPKQPVAPQPQYQ